MAGVRPADPPADFSPSMKRQLAEILGIDTRSLALFRIGLGLLLLLDLAIRVSDLSGHYSDDGVLPRNLLQVGFPSAHLLSASATWQAVLFAVAGLSAVCLTIGLWTRAATVASWYLLASLHERNPLVLNAGDVLLCALLFWSIFLPLGIRWSLDRRLRESSPPPDMLLTPATACILLQVCLVYWFTGYFKFNDTWLSGQGALNSLWIESYVRPLGEQLRQYRELVVWLGQATVFWEAFGTLLLFIPFRTGFWRLIVVAGFVLLHAGIHLTLTVGLFSYVCILAWTLFLPSCFWQVLRVVDAEDREGEPYPSQPTTEGPFRKWFYRLSQAVCTACFMFVVVINLRTAENRYAVALLPDPVWKTIHQAQFAQNWSLFSEPTQHDGWCVAAALLKDGRVVNLLRNGELFVYEKPERVNELYANHRWRKYCRYLVDENYQRFRAPFCQAGIRRWQAEHRGDEAIVALDLYWLEVEVIDGESDLTQILLHREEVESQGPFLDALERDELGLP